MAVNHIDSLTINDIKPITVSFKKNEGELILYKWVLRHSGYSGFIKDILRKEMNNETKEIVSLKDTVNKNSLIELDF
ncbi:hypothetical protein DP144_01765 [Clostridium tetani]|uniref:hypothetical protein n=1 Tax=Clostridium tetani TaxID=1513 RepID=UPI00100ABE62|nr:hypothetical protein [Clostridium tetani]RXM79560.1 hypothetical protein DP154_01765 [Clostridium tetani]RYV00373.1 hypothetical protein DP144_01765 [Clostridium tetani]